MDQASVCFPGFNRLGLCRKPLSECSRLARERNKLDGLCMDQLQTLCGHLLPGWLGAFKAASGRNSRKRLHPRAHLLGLALAGA